MAKIGEYLPMKKYQDINKETIDGWVDEGWEWGKPISREEYIDAKNGNGMFCSRPLFPCRMSGLGI